MSLVLENGYFIKFHTLCSATLVECLVLFSLVGFVFRMSHFIGLNFRKKILFLIILSLLVLLFQLFHVQKQLTINWQEKEDQTLDYASKIVFKYFSADGSLRKKPFEGRKFNDEIDSRSFDMGIDEIEVVNNYATDSRVDEQAYLKDMVDTTSSSKETEENVKFRNGQDGVSESLNEPSSIEQVNFASPKVQETGLNSKTNKPEITTGLKQRLHTRQLNKTDLKTLYFGFLNLHIWNNVCGDKVESLKEFILFPTSPSFRILVNEFETKGTNLNDIGIRIFGFLRPNESGLYKFGISSLGNSELWLSNDTKTTNLKLIASVGVEKEIPANYSRNYHKFPSQISMAIALVKDNNYFVEVLYKRASGLYGVEVAWMKPNSSDFQIISGKFLKLAVNDSRVANNTVTVEDYRERHRDIVSQGVNYMPFMDFMDFGDALPECEYEPSYYIKEKLVRFQGARNKSNTHFAEVYPPDSTNETLPLVQNEDIWWIENNYGNSVIDNETALHVGKMFTRTLEDKYNGTFQVAKLMSIERVVDKPKGNRYHIQMEVEDIYSGRHFEFSEFLYQPRGAGYLCFPRGFRWSKYANVNVIVPVKDSGRWALYFIKNIAEIAHETSDPHLHVIIVDYESTDIDVEAVLKKSSLSRYTVVRLPGNKKFNRAEALQKGADAVKDPHSILFLCDLHLEIPAKLIETVRKHCVEGKMAFAPVVKRLKCGFYPSHPFGYWETLGFGLFAIYKSDFDRAGAFDVKGFQNWGGEDWELLDRVLESRMEVERLNIPYFYHFYHPPFGTGNSRIGA